MQPVREWTELSTRGADGVEYEGVRVPHINTLDPSAPLDYYGYDSMPFNPSSYMGCSRRRSTHVAVLGVELPDDLDNLVAARMQRQRILQKTEPLFLWVVVGESVLYQEVGGTSVVRSQPAHLLA
ncbi:Scr1 family TA system antitoxin-like transcriptional regulator [Streptomyces sp. NPDC002889]|uniref:Scr1 family TA system antitoxin-like transcriptional regulator n=1 Tax=Streptomyces sp. NPDC002889 TaxID=3364669 RepID=UPI0036B0EE51